MQESRDLLAEGDRLLRSREYEQAGQIYEQAAALAEREENPSVLVESLAQVARCYSIRKLGSEGQPWLERARRIATSEHPAGWSRYLLVRGVYEREAGRRDEATRTFKELYEFCMQTELSKRAIDAAHHVAIAAGPEEQIHWAHKGIAAAESGGHDSWLAVLWNNLGWTLDELGRHEQAYEALENARRYHHATGGDHQKLVADWSLGHAARMLGKLDQARKILTDTLAWAKRRHEEKPSHDRLEWVGQCHWELGELAHAEGDTRRALELLGKARSFLIDAKIEKWWPEGLAKLDARIADLTKTTKK